MKKFSFLWIAFFLGSFLAVQAQETPEKEKGKKDVSEYLPSAGDFAITVNASPFLYYLGNLFNGTIGNGLDDFGNKPYLSETKTWNYIRPLISVSGKYMYTDKLGFRLNVGWMYNHDRLRYYAPDDAALMVNPLSEKKVVDIYRDNNVGASLSAAAEYRVGKRRVQGIFGGGLLYAFQWDRQTFSYGNAITELNQKPSCGMEPDVYEAPAKEGFNTMRYLSKYSEDPTHYLGIVLFVGVEWFITPQISLGGEVNIAAAYNWTRQRYYTAEGFNTLSKQTETWTELEVPSSRGFDFGTGNIGAAITLSFYFSR